MQSADNVLRESANPRERGSHHVQGIPGTADGDPSPYPGLIIEEIMDSASSIGNDEVLRVS